MELLSLNLDTYKAVNLLKGKGFTKKQSEGIMEVIQEATLSGVSSKQDVQNVYNKIQSVHDELKDNIQETKDDVQEVRQEISSLKVWFMGLILARTVGILGIVFGMLQFFLGKI